MTNARTTYHHRPVYVVDGSRSPLLKAAGKPGPFSASDLAVYAARNLLARLPLALTDYDEVVLGCVMPGPDEANIARISALRLGFSERTPAYTVQRNCASGMQAIDSAARNIASGNAELILCGGTESMSHAPLLFKMEMVRWLAAWSRSRSFMARSKTLLKLRPALFAPVIALIRGLSDPYVGLSMGQTAENIAHRFNITRTMMDEWAVSSHQRLAVAQKTGVFDHEIETLYAADGSCYQIDNGVRVDSSVGKLAKLKPVFDKHFGKVTAGNSAQITDGAAWLVLASEETIDKHDLPVLGEIKDSAWAGLDPAQMGLGPVHAMAPIMQRNKLSIHDIDYWEINEAFAGQVLACIEAFKSEDYCSNELKLDSALGAIDKEKLNIHGGGISMGHPVGASGARIILHLLNTLKANNAKTGMASLCIGGGQGGAVLVESMDAIQSVDPDINPDINIDIDTKTNHKASEDIHKETSNERD